MNFRPKLIGFRMCNHQSCEEFNTSYAIPRTMHTGAFKGSASQSAHSIAIQFALLVCSLLQFDFPFTLPCLAQAPKTNRDGQGDLLPPGAVYRIGTTRFRHAQAVISVD